MPLNTRAVLTHLVTLVGGLDGVQSCQAGVPAALGNQVVAWVSKNDVVEARGATGILDYDVAYLVEFAYRLSDGPSDAENVICDVTDALEAAISDDKTLGGLVKSAMVDMSLASRPQYRLMTQAEARIYPVRVITRQRTTFNTNV